MFDFSVLSQQTPAKGASDLVKLGLALSDLGCQGGHFLMTLAQLGYHCIDGSLSFSDLFDQLDNSLVTLRKLSRQRLDRALPFSDVVSQRQNFHPLLSQLYLQ